MDRFLNRASASNEQLKDPLAVVAMDRRRGFKGLAMSMVSLVDAMRLGAGIRRKSGGKA